MSDEEEDSTRPVFDQLCNKDGNAAIPEITNLNTVQLSNIWNEICVEVYHIYNVCRGRKYAVSEKDAFL